MSRSLTFGRSTDTVFAATFLRVGDAVERVGEVRTLVANDLIRVDGSVLVTVDAIVLLSDEIVDSVFMIWSFLLDGLISVGQGTAYSVSYPDLDYPVTMEEVEPRATTRHVRLTVGRGSAYATGTASWDDLYRAFGDAALAFVSAMETLAPRFASDYAEMREQVDAVRRYASESDARLYGPHRRQRFG